MNGKTAKMLRKLVSGDSRSMERSVYKSWCAMTHRQKKHFSSLKSKDVKISALLVTLPKTAQVTR